MKTARIAYGLYTLLIFISSIFVTSIFACTGIQIKAKDGSYINGRTVEFGIPLDIAGLVVPRNYEFRGSLPDGSSGMVYRSKYAVVGASTFGAPAVVDGMNEKGLSAGMFYFPGYASYATLTQENKKMALAPTEFVNWLLTQFASVDEVKQSIKSVVIAPTAPKGWGGVPPFHYVVYDKTGKSIAIEPLNGQLVVFDDPIGVITNSPTFDWHLTNLSNYINLSSMNAPSKQIDGYQLKTFGQGSGLRGLPGDFTPPSRFVRAAIYSATAIPAENSQNAVFDMFHILNQFDIPVGAVQSKDGSKIISEFTLATTVKDPQNLKYYIRTYEDQTIKSIDLRSFDLEGKNLMSVSVHGTQPVMDISKRVQISVNKG
ncbi:MAG: choloylglycine hydrolase family protein [Gammaproteobacteria bacterium]|nr:choloylglycine hydrolase family protein [Gammaproteobacteria bacterium]MCW5583261.1 choloylglycine hydrolase family protein [Gammaproteobacteria bacterium]